MGVDAAILLWPRVEAAQPSRANLLKTLALSPRDRDNQVMRSSHYWRAAVVLAVFVLACALGAKDKTFVMPKLEPAISYPAHDQHTTERVTVAADPYDTHTKLDIFTIPYRQLQVLPVLLVITNDGDEPVSMLDLDIQLSRARRMRLFPLSEQDIQRKLGPGRIPGPSPLPFPLPHGKNIAQVLHGEYELASLQAKAVEPHSTRGGFLFFDVARLTDPLAGASLTVSGLKDSNGKDLFFFEVPMDKYLNDAPVLQPRN
jgi:hypothetical protein